MKKRAGVKAVLCFFTVVLCMCSVPAFATIVSFEMSVIFEGTVTPTNPPPWLIATFDDGGLAGAVDLVISAPGLPSNGKGEKVAKMLFNLDPIFDQADLDVMDFSITSRTGQFYDPVITKLIDDSTHKADGDGYFDIMIDFDNDGWIRAFNGGDIIEYTITLAGLTADSFVFPSAADGAGTGVYVTAAHLLGLGEAGEDSSWVTVPEPATICLLGLGALGLLRKRRA